MISCILSFVTSFIYMTSFEVVTGESFNVEFLLNFFVTLEKSSKVTNLTF